MLAGKVQQRDVLSMLQFFDDARKLSDLGRDILDASFRPGKGFGRDIGFRRF